MKALAHEQFRRLEDRHWWFRGRRTVYLELLRGALAERGGRVPRALDVGCGAGGFATRLGRVADDVVAVDRAPEPLATCAERGLRSVVRCDARALPFDDASFDLVTLFDVLEHVRDERAALAETRRVLRPGGRLFVSVPAHAWLYAANDRVAGHERRYSRSALTAALRSVEFTVERATYTNVVLAPLIVPLVLGLRLCERARLFGRDPQHTNLSWPLPGPAHAALARIFEAELLWSRRRDAPFGHSLVAIARVDGGGTPSPRAGDGVT